MAKRRVPRGGSGCTDLLHGLIADGEKKGKGDNACEMTGYTA